MITLPIYWTETFKTKPDKVHLVGMNGYRNWHFHLSNKIKKDYHELVHNQINNIESGTGAYFLTITIYYKNSTCDGSNIASLMEKFVLDALQSLNVVEQDNVKHHIGTTWSVGGQDKENPRAEISIHFFPNL